MNFHPESNSAGVQWRSYSLFSAKLFIFSFISVTLFSGYLSILPILEGNVLVYASNQSNQSQQELQSEVPNVAAKSIYDNRSAILGNNVKNLIILIPDEAHHGNGEAKENRFIVQSFLPQTVVVNKGTKVIWFSGDVSHEHNIILNEKSNSSDKRGLFDSGQIAENSNSNPMIFSTVGDYEYISPDVSPEAEQKGFVMKGDVKVIDQPNKLMPSNISNNNTNNNSIKSNKDIETIGVYMVPAKDLDSYIRDFQNRGFSIDSTHTFKDVRGVARGTNSQQSLLVWTAGSDMSLDRLISALKEMTPTLPYK
ncbi:MAG TPA: hypothetical protein VH415_06270 [Nitrososphaeraceae archaeon]|jgi:plastocyanin